MTLITDDTADVTPIGDERYSVDFQSKVNVPQTTRKEHNVVYLTTRHAHILVKAHVGNIKNPCGGSDRTFGREHGEDLTPVGEDKMTSYGNGSNIPNGDKETHSPSIGYHRYRVLTPMYSGYTASTSNTGYGTFERTNVK